MVFTFLSKLGFDTLLWYEILTCLGRALSFANGEAYAQECAILPSQVGIWPQNAELVTPTSYLHIFFWKNYVVDSWWGLTESRQKEHK